MKRTWYQYLFLAIGLLILPAALIWLTIAFPPAAGDILPGVLFVFLIVFTNTFSVPLGPGQVSLLPMATVAAFLVTGPAMAGWAAYVGAWVQGWARFRFAEQLGLPPGRTRFGMLTITAVNANMLTLGTLTGSFAFQVAGGQVPLSQANLSTAWPLTLLTLGYLLGNHLVAGLYILLRSHDQWRHYRRALPKLVLFELPPMVFAPLMALVFTRIGPVQFLLLAAVIVATSLITRNLSLAQQRLQRRVQELDSLQTVGQVLSSSLEQKVILEAIRTQTAELMPAENFYVAQYHPETDEVSFPLAVENDQLVLWRSRRMGKGLTEHIIHSQEPLLVRSDFEGVYAKLGLQQIGRPSGSFLGVPILAGAESLGVIAVQAEQPGVYDAGHQEVLQTIAAQAAVAIQNARLYTQTDEALARRVLELSSILRTTQEGILLLDREWRGLAANRAVATFLGLAQAELTGQVLHASRPGGGPSPLELMGYTLSGLESDCRSLADGSEDTIKVRISVPGPPERYVERTLTPVRDRSDAIVGWLLVLRDLTEERELARLREEMTHMLIHDLRSPLTVIGGSLEMMGMTLPEGNLETNQKLLGMAKQGSARMLAMVNSLLGISKLESGKMTLEREMVSVRPFLEEIAAQLAPLATTAQIAIEIGCEEGVPTINVDRTLIGRVLNNLLDNAVKFTPDGGHIRLWAKADVAGNGSTILMGVSDTGPGIPAEERERVFEKFQQVDSIQGRRAGTGLGLAFCKLAVEEHGGRIWVEEASGGGSSFVMRLPVGG